VVAQGARIAVRAVGLSVGKRTTEDLVTHIVRARIAILARDELTDAGARDALFGGGAGVCVITGDRVQWLMRTARRRVTRVLGTDIAVVTRRLVCLSITVVVYAVAGLRRRNERVTFSKPQRAALALPDARSKVVGDLTGRRETQGGRRLGARAEPTVGHALGAHHALDARPLLAHKTLWTGRLVITAGSTKRAFAKIG